MAAASGSLAYSVLTAGETAAALKDLARLRIAVFADWPYLYEGDAAYEAGYLARFAASPGAVIVAARDQDGRMVGAATAAPLADHAAEFASPFARAGLDPGDFFYLAESVLVPDFRGQGAGRAFFDMREAEARAQGYSRSVFCAVIRPDDHPARPAAYQSLEPFWRRLGYQPLAGLVAEFSWRDRGEAGESVKPMQVWSKML